MEFFAESIGPIMIMALVIGVTAAIKYFFDLSGKGAVAVSILVALILMGVYQWSVIVPAITIWLLPAVYTLAFALSITGFYNVTQQLGEFVKTTYLKIPSDK
jgi:hypothetical protein